MPYNDKRVYSLLLANNLVASFLKAAMFGNFYTEYKPRLWWFFIPVHMTGDVALSFLGVALACSFSS